MSHPLISTNNAWYSSVHCFFLLPPPTSSFHVLLTPHSQYCISTGSNQGHWGRGGQQPNHHPPSHPHSAPWYPPLPKRSDSISVFHQSQARPPPGTQHQWFKNKKMVILGRGAGEGKVALALLWRLRREVRSFRHLIQPSWVHFPTETKTLPCH